MSKIKVKLLLLTACLPVLALQSCFKDEPLNAECDIEQVSIHAANPQEVFFNLTDTLVNVASGDSVVTFTVRDNVNLNELTPTFKLTPGATIEQTQPLATGSEGNSNVATMRYRVTSQDGNWHRDYRIEFQSVVTVVTDTIKFDFEHYELDPGTQKYYIWHNVLADGTLGNQWATGNPGFRLSMGTATPQEYPTIPLKDGYDGAGVTLTTLSTGAFGEWVDKRIAAGNLFLGSFDVTNALKDAMQATRFGIPFDKKPVKFTGYYKYTPGPQFQDEKGNIVPSRTDSAAIYAVFYLNHDSEGNAVMLHGDDVQTNPNIVAIAKMYNIQPTTQWTPFSVDFYYYTSDLNPSDLANRRYNLTIVFSSSYEGDKFQGAVGSQLMVDKVRLITETRE